MTTIPYTTEVRPDTGVTNPRLGIWLFLASEVMLFGSLFSAYALLRTADPNWPDQSTLLNVPLATLNTVMLLSSSVTTMLGIAALRGGHFTRFRRYLLTTLLLGTAFLGVKAVEYSGELSEGLRPSSNNFLGLYFTMTGLHALHVLGGIAVFAFLLAPGSRMWNSDPKRFIGRIEVTGIYWQFVDVVWLCIFPVLYLL